MTSKCDPQGCIWIHLHFSCTSISQSKLPSSESVLRATQLSGSSRIPELQGEFLH